MSTEHLSAPARPVQAPGAAGEPTTPGTMKVSWRGRVALRAGVWAVRASRLFGFGGGMIGGRVALVVYPGILRELSAGRRVVLVSGTNGKTTTTALLAAAMRSAGAVTSNSDGANMLDGVTTALATSKAPTAVVEIDELYLPQAVAQTAPAVLVLLNLTRDQLDRAGEIRRTAIALRRLADTFPDLVVVANCDDPYVVSIATSFANVVWVAAGTGLNEDARTCPHCGHRLSADDADDLHWQCTRCGLFRPLPQWWLSHNEMRSPGGDELGGPLVMYDGSLVPLQVNVPGVVNRANAAMAVAAAYTLGVAAEKASVALSSVTEAAGRYRTLGVGEHEVQLVLAKNPAGWAATLNLVCADRTPVIISINAGEADGRDTSWLYDVNFDRLRGRLVIASGARAADLGVRLSYAGVDHLTIADSPAALETVPAGPVTLIADYTSFAQLRNTLGALSDGH
ncbi:MurT ligase domain-containing protein [Amycolatopsis sp.]|uniref:MurT ligase domain-containing protein n=1 Tax=Amycolatopsis sp. TaxID=37632 RepID=UPI00261EC532|nr:Mur ligase family protein [Amycolatopsis sp.]